MNTQTIRRAHPRRLLPASVLVLLTLATLTACSTRLTPTVAEVSGRDVELVETGSGEATVVFESGWGNDWSAWDQVASEVSGHARVFAYSRPGYGRSDPTTEPRDGAHIVEDLRALLVARGYAPPYVLVGHSFGGTYLELFARAHPEEVAALVLVEPRPADFSRACEHAAVTGCIVPRDVLRSRPPVEIAEYEAFGGISAQLAATGGFGSYPVRVLTATSHGFSPAGEHLWVWMHAAIADAAEDGDQWLFEGAGHNLETDRAQDVTQIILSVLPADPVVPAVPATAGI